MHHVYRGWTRLCRYFRKMLMNTTYETQITVRYADTDQMGYVYYGKYAEYFEVARVDALKQQQLSYKIIEQNGVMLPVSEYNIKYIKPAFYDDTITIHTQIELLSSTRIKFLHQSFVNEKKINEAHVILVFVDLSTRKPISAPDYILKSLKLN